MSKADNAVVEYVGDVCGLYFRSILLPNVGDRAWQHVHDHDHATYIGNGSARLIIDGEPRGVYLAGQAVAVLAGHHHEFVALEENTRLTCVHDVASDASLKEKGL